MALDPVINFGKVTVSTTGYNASATSITLAAGHGARLPSTFSYNLVWWNVTDYQDPSDDPNREIVRCTARSTDTLTVTRAQEGTAASTKNTNDKVYKMILSVTKKTIEDIASDIAAVDILTTKGDLLTFSTVKARLGVGTDSQVLTAASSQTTGLKWATPSTVPSAATQAEQETGTSTTTYASPGRQQFHASAAKAWVRLNWVAGAPTVIASYNISSLTDTGVGAVTVNFTVSFSSALYTAATSYNSMDFSTQQQLDALASGFATTSAQLRYVSNGTPTDNTEQISAVFHGDQ